MTKRKELLVENRQVLEDNRDMQVSKNVDKTIETKKTRIDLFDQNIDVTTDRDRLVKSDFTINIRAVPEVAQVIVGTEVIMSLEELKEKLEGN